MRKIRLITSWLAALILAVPAMALAENSRDFGDYVIHYNAMQLISYRRKLPASIASPAVATVA